MEMQAEAERKRRAQVLESEGERQSNINIADGKKNSVILESEAAKMDQVNRAQGEAEAILARAEATAKGIAMVSKALQENGGMEAASLRVAEQYIQAFSQIAKKGTTVLLPSSPASMMVRAFSIYKNMIGNKPGNGSSSSKAETQDPTRSDASSVEFGEESSPTAEADEDVRLGELELAYSLCAKSVLHSLFLASTWVFLRDYTKIVENNWQFSIRIEFRLMNFHLDWW